MDALYLPQELPFRGKTLVLPHDMHIDPSIESFFILDFSRKFDDPDLTKLPANIVQVNSRQERYLLFKYHVVLGAVSER